VHVPEGPLDRDQIEHFRTYGYTVLEDCFDTGPGSVAEAWCRRTWRRSGYDPDDADTWTKAKIHFPVTERRAIEKVAPKALAAMHQLVGGPERMARFESLSDAFIVNYHWRADQPYVPPSAGAKGWHKDGDFFVHFLDSPEQALLTIFMWSDVLPDGGGATYIAADSPPVVARWFAEHPEGAAAFGPDVDPSLDPSVTVMNAREWIAECRDFREIHGRAGSVAFMHPFMLHAASQNLRGYARMIANPPAHLREPMRFDRPDGRYSVVERTILDTLGVDRFDYRPTGRRQRLVPPRVLRWKEFQRQGRSA